MRALHDDRTSEHSRFFLSGIEWQSERRHDSLEIVSPVKFDFDPAAFLTVMNHDVGREVLLQTILEIAQAGRAESFGLPAAPGPARFAEEARHHPLRRPDGRALA